MEIQVIGVNKPWVENDAEILRSIGHNVKVGIYSTRKDFLRYATRKKDFTVIWMGGYGSGWFAKLPTILRKHTIVIYGGGEFWKKLLDTKFYSHIKRGIENLDGHIFTGPHMISLCIKAGLVVPKNLAISLPPVDPKLFTIGTKHKRTAALAGPFYNYDRLRQKGVSQMIKIAELNPDWKFYLVGVKPLFDFNGNVISPITNELPDNVYQTQYFENHHQGLSSWASIAKKCEVSLTLGPFEGGPVTLFESMLAGCIPIVGNGIYNPLGGPYSNINGSKNMDEILDSVLISDPEQLRKIALPVCGPDQRKKVFEQIIERALLKPIH